MVCNPGKFMIKKSVVGITYGGFIFEFAFYVIE